MVSPWNSLHVREVLSIPGQKRRGFEDGRFHLRISFPAVYKEGVDTSRFLMLNSFSETFPCVIIQVTFPGESLLVTLRL